MYKQLYIQHLERQNVTYSEPREDIVRVAYNADNFKSLPILAFFDKDGEEIVQFKCFDIINLQEKHDAAAIACNELNNHYRWVTFVIDEDGDIVCSADTYVCEENCGQVCEHMMDRMADIVDKAFPTFAKIKYA